MLVKTKLKPPNGFAKEQIKVTQLLNSASGIYFLMVKVCQKIRPNQLIGGARLLNKVLLQLKESLVLLIREVMEFLKVTQRLTSGLILHLRKGMKRQNMIAIF